MSDINPRNIFLYALPALPISFAGLPLYIHAPDFYTTGFGVSLTTIGFILLFIRLIDAVQDPLIGRFSDAFSGARFLIFVFASVLLAVSFTALFHPNQDYPLLWFGLFMFSATTAFSILSINLQTLGGIWPKKPAQKTLVSAWREGFSVIGLMAAMILPPLLKEYAGVENPFTIVAIILSLMLVLSALSLGYWFKGRVFQSVKNSKPSGSDSWIGKMKGPLFLFFVTFAISSLASAIPALLLLFFIRDLLGAENLTGLFLIIYFLSAFASMPLWIGLSKKFGKLRSWLISMVLATLAFIWALSLENGDLLPYGIICFITGIAAGGELAMPPAILADLIQKEKLTESATTFYGVLGFLMKSGLSLASVIVLPFLESQDFQPGKINSSEALNSLSYAYSILPCMIKLVAILFLFRFNRNFPSQDNEKVIFNSSRNPYHPHI